MPNVGRRTNLPILLLALPLVVFALSASADTPEGPFNLRFEGTGKDLVVLDPDADLYVSGFANALCPNLKVLPNGKATAKCKTDILGQGLNQTKVTRWTKPIAGGFELFQRATFGGCNKNGGVKVCLDGFQTISYPITTTGGEGKYKVDVKVCASAGGQKQCGKSKNSSDFDVPPLAGGAGSAVKPVGWNLMLDLKPKGKNKVKGTGTVMIDEGRTIKMKVAGKVNKQGIATLKLKPKKKKDKSSVELENVTFDGTALGGDAKWKLLSQKGSAAFDAMVLP